MPKKSGLDPYNHLFLFRIQRLKEMKIKTVVPGHGKISSVLVIDQNITFLKKSESE